ncbi:MULTISPECIES: hypothetical protein [Microbacterium]|uniref:hypothetical protein n=1 Tax=Microbacterium TaxID=33882 RepID=UPI00051A6FE6|nr:MULTISPECIES: hypothetical protein [Microbacterium]MCE7481342.1 hypothetical protein [Microbacterium profundi]
MRNKNRLGLLTTAGAGVAALALTGFALPATADDGSSSVDDSTTSTDVTGSTDAIQDIVRDLILASGNDTSTGDIGLDGPLVDGPVVSDIGNGAILSGNDTPVASGNEVSGNEVSAPVGSGNEVSAPVEAPIEAPVEAPVDAPVGSGNDTTVDAPVETDNDTGLSLDDIGGDIGADVDSLVSGLLD